MANTVTDIIAKDDTPKMVRPPVVVVLGHVDHGKTTLLDKIRETNVAAKEAGGITQHIGAYQVTVSPYGEPSSRAERGISSSKEILRPTFGGAQDDFATASRKITFIDTPGHEAFSKMRSRGARVADIAVLVVAVDEGVRPQTLESLNAIQQAGIPYVVALNRIDKPEAQIDRVKKELTDAGILLEGWGGNIPNVAISAKTGEGVPDLLELILLLAELAELKAEAEGPAIGVVIEAHLDSRRGTAVTLLVKNGTLNLGDDLNVADGTKAKIKSMENFLGAKIEQAGPSMPVLVLGFSELPQVGCEFWVGGQQEKKVFAGLHGISRYELEIRQETTEVMLPLIIKVDVQGSIEAVESVLRSLPTSQVGLRVLHFGVGNVTENDVKLAASSGARIVGFRVNVPKLVLTLAGQLNTTIKAVDIIYELADVVKNLLRPLLGIEVIRTDIGAVSVLAKFKYEGKRMVVGGKVVSGVIIGNTLVDIVRSGKLAGRGKLLELQQNKVPVERVEQGNECGMLIDGDTLIQVGDTLKFYTEERRERKLE